jgi:hypothetical protein
VTPDAMRITERIKEGTKINETEIDPTREATTMMIVGTTGAISIETNKVLIKLNYIL